MKANACEQCPRYRLPHEQLVLRLDLRDVNRDRRRRGVREWDWLRLQMQAASLCAALRCEGECMEHAA